MALDTNAISPLGFGCMRFIGHEDDTVDVAQVAEMIDAYMQVGGNYFDTAWAYPSSEKTLKEALVDRYPRDSFMIASKCVAWTGCACAEDLERQLQETLSTLGVDYLDVYLMHNLGGSRTAAFEKFDAWNFVKSVKERGLAKHIGFSAHCTPEELEGFIASYPEAEVVQLQVNYADYDSATFRERECVEIAVKHGLPVIVMEPLKGGLLADPPASVKEIFDERMPDDSYATAALRFAASCPNVVTTLSGMATVEQVRDNCRLIAGFRPMSDEEMAVIRAAQEALASSKIVPCTGCDYCAKVCPANIGISQSINVLNHFINFGDAADSGWLMGFVVRFNAGKNLPVDCTRCGSCVEACPQGIDILECFDRIQDEIFSVAPTTQVLMKYNTLPKGN